LALFDIVIPDGIAVLWSSILFGTSFRRGQIVTTYESVVPVLVHEAIREGWSFFLFGAAPGVAARAGDNLVRTFPGVRIAGTHHGYVGPGEDMDAVVGLIARSKPTILLVALPQPKQEAWILRYRAELGANAVFAVGGYFDKLAKSVSIYPDWVKRTQLYWLYRLLTEPKRVWTRYTFGVPLFIWNVLRTRFRGEDRSLERAA
jgi:N-acetylglucosaminyldiphosphoundecaprenol N-acetyl-beta-D-mannosaminyltransferase